MSKNFDGDYWDFIGQKFSKKKYENFWRAHMKEIYQKLMDRWDDNSKGGFALKTDLYDEAVTNHYLLPLFGKHCSHAIGTDISFEVAAIAKRRMRDKRNRRHNIVVSDVRNMAFESNSFDKIVSNSTLDHFSHKEDIIMSIRELWRILKPGGTLFITLDNPLNPIIYLRNHLPYILLKSLRIIPYYMGITVTKRELTRILETNSFEISESTFIYHAPRILIIWIGYLLNKTADTNPKITNHFLKVFRIFEHLEKLPFRYASGYYIAIKAKKISHLLNKEMYVA